jgi:hypothetical protein
VITVGMDVADVEQRLGEGGLRCPGCAGTLRGWGHARERVVRGLGGAFRVRPRRARCRDCRRTHVLLPVRCWARRADAVEVIGAAFEARAAGLGFRRIAAGLDRPEGTVRGWLRRLGGRLEEVRSWFTRLVVRLGGGCGLPSATGSVWADAVAAVAVAAVACVDRFAAGSVVATVTVWQAAAAVTHGGLLAPAWPEGGCNTSWL